MVIGYILWAFGTFLPVRVYLATLTASRYEQ
jgi:hypothetical protein